MTEAEWDGCADPQAMLDLVEARASGRKLRLFAVACCRRIQDCLSPVTGLPAVKVAERYADCRADDGRLRKALGWAARSSRRGAPAAHAASAPGPRYAANSTGYEARLASGDLAARAFERAAHCGLLRCLFGNPFRPLPTAPS